MLGNSEALHFTMPNWNTFYDMVYFVAIEVDFQFLKSRWNETVLAASLLPILPSIPCFCSKLCCIWNEGKKQSCTSSVIFSPLHDDFNEVITKISYSYSYLIIKIDRDKYFLIFSCNQITYCYSTCCFSLQWFENPNICFNDYKIQCVNPESLN